MALHSTYKVQSMSIKPQFPFKSLHEPIVFLHFCNLLDFTLDLLNNFHHGRATSSYITLQQHLKYGIDRIYHVG